MTACYRHFVLPAHYPTMLFSSSAPRCTYRGATCLHRNRTYTYALSFLLAPLFAPRPSACRIFDYASLENSQLTYSCFVSFKLSLLLFLVSPTSTRCTYMVVVIALLSSVQSGLKAVEATSKSEQLATVPAKAAISLAASESTPFKSWVSPDFWDRCARSFAAWGRCRSLVDVGATREARVGGGGWVFMVNVKGRRFA